MRRPDGTGSMYQRADGRWMCSLPMPSDAGRRRRRVVSAKTKDALLERLATLGIEWKESPARPRAVTRREQMVAARALGTHTNAEWVALCRRTPFCRYCEAELNIWNESKDHAIPVARGGSDGIENIQRTCWECNFEKGNLMPDEYRYRGKPRGFKVHPLRRAEWERFTRRAEEWRSIRG